MACPTAAGHVTTADHVARPLCLLGWTSTPNLHMIDDEYTKMTKYTFFWIALSLLQRDKNYVQTQDIDQA
jgi:hypothetical protein